MPPEAKPDTTAMRYTVYFFNSRHRLESIPCKTLKEASDLHAAAGPDEKAYVVDNVTGKKILQ